MEPNRNELAILSAVNAGQHTARDIRPSTAYESMDSVTVQCKQLQRRGFLRSEKRRVAHKVSPWGGSRPMTLFWSLTDQGMGIVNHAQN
jgi:hypothetical protein